MTGWDRLAPIVAEEFKQSDEEGKAEADLKALRQEWETCAENSPQLRSIHERLLNLPIRPGFPYQEPNDWEAIQSLTSPLPPLSVPSSNLEEAMHGAWLGRCVGCALGKPVEGIALNSKSKGFRSWEILRHYLKSIHPEEWPLRDYFPAYSPVEEQTGKTCCPDSTREKIAFMETDDDIRYTVLGQLLVQKHGTSFTSWNVANLWMTWLPYKDVCTAETQAYLNLVNAAQFHLASSRGEISQSVDWTQISTQLNPYREWIGAQIRVDSYGYAAPGNPQLAARMAWTDARISHVKNGIYGAMFCSAMIATAFSSKQPETVVQAGMAVIPKTSRLHQVLSQTVGIAERHTFATFEQALHELYELVDHYHPVHTINNAALCALAVLLSKGDFHQGITLAVMGGWDTDCNGATVGSVLGAMNGAARLPNHWTGRLNDTLKSKIPEYHPISIRECARRSCEIVKSSVA